VQKNPRRESRRFKQMVGGRGPRISH
jgi:hypothetical protein